MSGEADNSTAPHFVFDAPRLLDETVLCSCCMASNRPIDEFCVECGMPIGQFVATDPFKSIETRWRYIGRAADGQISRWTLWGFWLMLGPHVFLAGIAVLFMVYWGGWDILSGWVMTIGEMADDPRHIASGSDWSAQGVFKVIAIVIGTIVGLAEYVIYGILLYRVTRRYRDQHGLAPGPG